LREKKEGEEKEAVLPAEAPFPRSRRKSDFFFFLHRNRKMLMISYKKKNNLLGC